MAGLLLAIVVDGRGVAEAQQPNLGQRFGGLRGLGAGAQPEAGLYLGDQFLFYAAGQLRDRGGAVLPVDPRLRVVADVIGVVGVVPIAPLHGFLDVGIGVPFTRITASPARPDLQPVLQTDRYGLGDIYVQPARLGWRLPHVDLVAGYAFYAPTGDFEPGPRGGVTRGQWSHELSAGGSVYLDERRALGLSALASYELSQAKLNVDIRRGGVLQLQGGLGGYVHRNLEVGAAFFALWQVSDDSGADLPPVLAGARERAYGLGPQVGLVIPEVPLRIAVRYEHELGVRARPEGQMLVAEITLRLLR